MSEIYYSSNEELFNDDDWRDSADRVFDDVDAKVGDIRTIYSGEAIKYAASDFTLDYIEQMGEQAYDNVGESAQDFPDCTPDQEKELIESIKKVIDAWASNHGLHPRFWGIKNQKPLRVKLVADGEYELLDKNKLESSNEISKEKSCS